MKKEKRNTIFIELSICCITLLLLCYCSIYISPIKFWPSALMGLVYPYILYGNIFFLLFWAIKRHKMFFVVLITILLGWNHARNHFRFSFFPTKKCGDNEMFSLLSYNVRIFNHYQWASDKMAQSKIFDMIDSLNPDIVCFQEFLANKEGTFTETDILSNLHRTPYSHIFYNGSISKSGQYGIATLSRFPIINKGEILLKNSLNTCIWSDLKINDDTVRVYNAHLQSVRFERKTLNYIDSIRILGYNESHVNEIATISNKLKAAYQKRALQATQIEKHIQKSPYPVILCGDFNDTPVSYTYHVLRKGMKDAFAHSGIGFSNTYISSLSLLRIDYILYRKELKPCNYKIEKVNYSDHYPVWCKFRIKK